MTSKPNKTTVMLIMAVVGILIGVVFAPLIATVMVRVNDISCQLPTVFSLKWRHSVEKQLWQEVYELNYPKIVLNKTYLQTFGAGTPTSGKSTPAPQGYLGQTVNQSFDELNWLVSINMQGEIILGDALYPSQALMIYQKIPNQSTVNIRPAKLTAWQYLQTPSCQSQFD